MSRIVEYDYYVALITVTATEDQKGLVIKGVCDYANE